MNGMESSPNSPERISNAPLELDATERLDLHLELRDLSTELAENPFVTPFSTVTEFTGIQLETPSKKGASKGIAFKIKTEANEEPLTEITFTGDGSRENEQRIYLHRPSLNLWEELRPGLGDASKLMSNLALLSALEKKLPDSIFEPLADVDPQGADIALLLADYLRTKAHSRSEYLHYRAPGVVVGGYEYKRESDFVVKATNDRVVRSLFVAASQAIPDYGIIRRVYGYETVDQNGVLESANGTLELRAKDRVSKARLDAYARSDARDNDASLGIQNGINDIRKAYGLTHQVN